MKPLSKEDQKALDELNGSSASPAPPAEPPSRLAQAAEWVKSHPLTAAATVTPFAAVPAALHEGDLSEHGAAGAALRGFGQGEGYNFVDELRGATGAMDEYAQRGPLGTGGTRPNSSFLDALKGRYVEERDAARKEDATAASEHPGFFYGGQAVGSLASPSPTGKAAVARLGFTGLQGFASGLGGAEHLDTEGAKDAGEGLAVGLGGGLIGEGMNASRGLFQKGVDTAREAINAKNEQAIAKAIASQKGKLGGAVQTGSRDLEVLGREAPHIGDPSLANAVARFQSSPEADQLLNQVVSNKLSAAPSHLESIDTEKQALANLINGAPGELASRNAAAEQSPISSVVAPRVARYVGRAVMPMVGGAAGGEIGDQLGFPRAGMAMGTAAGMAIGGNPGTAFANAMRDPRLALGLGKAGAAVSGAMSKVPSATGRTTETFLQKMRQQREEQPRDHFIDGTGG